MEDVSTAKVCDEDALVFSTRMRMLGRRCTTIVSCFRGVPELHLEHYQVGVSDGVLSLREMCFRT